jgi:hypothetical protein
MGKTLNSLIFQILAKIQGKREEMRIKKKTRIKKLQKAIKVEEMLRDRRKIFTHSSQVEKNRFWTEGEP